MVSLSYLPTPLDNLWMKQLRCVIRLLLLLENKTIHLEALPGSFSSCVDVLQASSRAYSPGGKCQASPAAPWSSCSFEEAEGAVSIGNIFCYWLLRAPWWSFNPHSLSPLPAPNQDFKDIPRQFAIWNCILGSRSVLFGDPQPSEDDVSFPYPNFSNMLMT